MYNKMFIYTKPLVMLLEINSTKYLYVNVVFMFNIIFLESY